MLLSFFWFAAGALCSLALLRLGRRPAVTRRALLEANWRRARLDRASTMDAMPPDAFGGEVDPPMDVEREIARLTGRAPSLYTQETLDRARAALRPGLNGLGIHIRTRQ